MLGGIQTISQISGVTPPRQSGRRSLPLGGVPGEARVSPTQRVSPPNPVPPFSTSGHPSAAETPTQMASQAVEDKRVHLAAHASEARDQFTRNGGEPFTSPRRISSGIKARQQEAVCFVSVGLRQFGQILPVFTGNSQGSQLTTASPHNPPKRFAKESVGGFHRLSSFNPSQPEAVVTPSLEAC